MIISCYGSSVPTWAASLEPSLMVFFSHTHIQYKRPVLGHIHTPVGYIWTPPPLWPDLQPAQTRTLSYPTNYVSKELLWAIYKSWSWQTWSQVSLNPEHQTWLFSTTFFHITLTSNWIELFPKILFTCVNCLFYRIINTSFIVCHSFFYHIALSSSGQSSLLSLSLPTYVILHKYNSIKRINTYTTFHLNDIKLSISLKDMVWGFFIRFLC